MRMKSKLVDLIKKQKDNFPLDQSFYIDKDIYDIDLKNIFFNQWIFVGHESRIPKKGDYFLFNVGDESIIVIRGNNQKVNCFYNVCRHRGSHICLEKEGKKNKLICPYHSWVYDLEGNLIKARMMPENFNKDEWGLHKCNSKNFEGLIFINLSDKPDSFDDFISPTKDFIKLMGNGVPVLDKITNKCFVKQTGKKYFAIVDAAMNDLIRPAFYESYHEIVPIKQSKKRVIATDIVGGICETGDTFCKDRPIPRVSEGDLIAMLSAGAYGFVMAGTYNTRPMPAEILVKGRKSTVVRKRQKIKDIWVGESTAPWQK